MRAATAGSSPRSGASRTARPTPSGSRSTGMAVVTPGMERYAPPSAPAGSAGESDGRRRDEERVEAEAAANVADERSAVQPELPDRHAGERHEGEVDPEPLGQGPGSGTTQRGPRAGEVRPRGESRQGQAERA